MGVIFIITYHEDVVREDISKLPPLWKKKVRRAIEEKLTTEPETFGKPLRRSLRGYRRLRVGDYRVVFRINGKKVRILAIQHRSVAYKRTDKRM